ncbi:MAG: hypothetical protein ACOY93_11890 [Bacillota bacterium]
MQLKPVIASYSGEAYGAISRFLTADVLEVVARVARAPVGRADLDGSIRDELQAMHVLREERGLIHLNTAVFLEEDIRRVNAAAQEIGAELAALVAEAAAEMRDEPPVVTNFLVGIIGIGQSLGQLLRREGIAVDWAGYGGKYARSKVDFNEVCAAYDALGPDLQNKGVHRGSRYTAVFIGPGGVSYLLRPPAAGTSPAEPGYTRQLNAFLTDAFAELISGKAEHPALWSAAEQVGLVRDGRPEADVLTQAQLARCMPIVHQVGEITRGYFMSRLGALQDLLRSTASGRQGVPPASMMMHLWRYLRRAIAGQMYATGIFTDRAPETGLITIFYANDLRDLDALLR